MAAAESGRPSFAHNFEEGTAHFNAGRYWEAHESWETLWLVSQTEMKPFLQGLIQIAAAYLHLRRLNFPGAGRLFDAGLRRLEAAPPGLRALLQDAFLSQVRADAEGTHAAHSRAGGHYQPGSQPLIVLRADWRDLVGGDEW